MKTDFQKFILAAIFSGTLLILSGCASSKDANSTESDRVSNIPWNKPQSWEGGGALGGALGGAR